MHESEANSIVLPADELPPVTLERFAEVRTTVTSRTLIPWGEHCSECSMPACYRTCDLYQCRPDGRCRRFVEGMVRIPFPGALNGYILKITFKRWAKFWATARLRLYPLQVADAAESRDLRLASCIQLIPAGVVQSTLIQKRYSWKKRSAKNQKNSPDKPNCLLIECYNPAAASVHTTLTIRNAAGSIPFQASLPMLPGFNRHRISADEIAAILDLSLPLDLDLAPNEVSETCTLYFGAMDFAVDSSYTPASSSPVKTPAPVSARPRLCKCVVWDLDNTIWNGTLIEDGLAGISLKPEIPKILKALDERGILISAVSKNNPEDALAALGAFQIADYFLFPQISWMPKSQSIRQIAAQLNIGADTFLFVDDSPFEREQVATQCPDVTILDASEYLNILDRPDCQVPVTDESRKRRSFYREQQVREGARQNFNGAYHEFLRSCDLRLAIHRLTEANLERVHELTQRTNQMNFSGNLYTREQLNQVANDPQRDTYVLDCADRFGNYGTVGFSIVNNAENRMTDLMFSCRVQGKRVEHAFVSHLLRYYLHSDAKRFVADYRKTPRNAQSGQVFQDLGFESLDEVKGVTRLEFPSNAAPPDEGIVTIHDFVTSAMNPVSV